MRFTADPLAAQNMAVLASVDWDGGLNWVRALNAHRQIDRDQFSVFRHIARLSDGSIVAVGSCYQGNLNGMVRCNDQMTPLYVRLNERGGLDAIATDDTIGTTDDADYRFAGELGSSVLGYRVTIVLNSPLGALGSFDSDGGFTPRVTFASAYGAVSQQACKITRDRAYCAIGESAPFSSGSCSLPTGAPNRGDAIVVELDAELRCANSSRIENGGVNIGGPSTATDGGILLYGISGPSHFGGGLQTAANESWVAAWSAGAFSRVGLNTQFRVGPTLATQVEELSSAVIVQTLSLQYVGFPNLLYGTRHSESGVIFTLLDRSDLSTPIGEFVINDDNVAPMTTIESTQFFVIADKLAVLVTGVNVRFGTRQLSSDGVRRSHLIILRHLDGR